jgi:hypothetical protein
MNFPILLLSNYRTGSSALVYSLGQKYNLKVFSEPHIYPNSLKELNSMLKHGNKNFIIKFMPDYIDKVQEYQDIYNSNCYKIKLTRKDKVAQVTSYYIAKITKKWNNMYGTAPSITPYFVEINNINTIDESIEKISNIDILLETSNIKFDEHIVYEDADFSNAPIDKLIAPVNYQKIYSYIETRMKQKNVISY